LEVVESDFCIKFLMDSTDFFDKQCRFLMNIADFLEIRGGRIRRISPKFDKIG
jgi:hypothetical protein